MSQASAAGVEIVEVGPRDGYQGIGPFIPTETKISLLERLVAAGLRRIEIGSFVSPKALPQMRDTADILQACAAFPGLKPQVLVPNEKWGREAVAAGAKQLVFVLSVSESHNRNNVRRSPGEEAVERRRVPLPQAGEGMRPEMQLTTTTPPATRSRCPARSTAGSRWRS